MAEAVSLLTKGHRGAGASVSLTPQPPLIQRCGLCEAGRELGSPGEVFVCRVLLCLSLTSGTGVARGGRRLRGSLVAGTGLVIACLLTIPHAPAAAQRQAIGSTWEVSCGATREIADAHYCPKPKLTSPGSGLARFEGESTDPATGFPQPYLGPYWRINFVWADDEPMHVQGDGMGMSAYGATDYWYVSRSGIYSDGELQCQQHARLYWNKEYQHPPGNFIDDATPCGDEYVEVLAESDFVLGANLFRIDVTFHQPAGPHLPGNVNQEESWRTSYVRIQCISDACLDREQYFCGGERRPTEDCIDYLRGQIIQG